MDHRIKALIAASLLSLSGLACAGYAQATPPKGWVPPPAGSGAPGGFVGTSAANTATFVQNTVRTNASLNVGGRIVTIPAEFRFAQNAPRYAAAAIMRHPYIRTAASIAGWLGLAGLVYDATSGLWTTPDPDALTSDGYIYYSQRDVGIHYSLESLCAALVADYSSPPSNWTSIEIHQTKCDLSGWTAYRTGTNEYGSVGGNFSPHIRDLTISRRLSNCPAGWYVTPAGCTQTAQPKTVTQDEAVEELTRHPMPEEIPNWVPEPLPVELPSFPPFFVPSSEPRVNPNYNPELPASPDNAPYYQPGVEVKPAPTASTPWQVSITPQNQPVVDPTQVGSETRPLPDGSGGGSGGGSETKPPEAADDFCARNPGVIACQTLEHEDDDTKLPEKEIEFEFNLISGFADSATCPAFPNVGDMLGGRQISWQPFCDTLAKLKNLLLAFAWASAAFILLGSRGD